VKSYILGYLLPKAINRSLKFLTPKLTLIYLQVIEKAMQIEMHMRPLLEAKVKHLQLIQKLHLELLECKGVQFSREYLNEYADQFVSFLSTFKASREEVNRRNGLKILRLYMDEFYKQLLAPLSDHKEKEAILKGTTFMTKVTAELLVHLSDYFDTVREEAQLLLVCMI